MPYPNRESRPGVPDPKSTTRKTDRSFLTSPSERPASALSRALPALLFALLVIAVYADPLFHRRNFAGRDLFVYNLPMEKTIHDAYARGSLPIWMPEVSGGRPLLPNPNAGALYPVRPALSAVSFPAAMRLYPILHWLAAGIGMILLVRTGGGSRAAAWLGATTYVFSGVVVAEVFFPHIQPGMALLPWITWAVARRRATRGGKLLLLSTLLSLLLLAGDVFTIGMALVCAVLWILLEIERPRRGSEAVILALAFLLAALVALPQIVATALWVPHTNRAVSGILLRDSAFFSIHPLRLLELVVPYPFGRTWTLANADVWGWPVFRGKAMGLFTTLYAGAFGAIAVVLCRKVRAPGARFARAALGLAVLLSVPFSLLPESWEKAPSPLPLRNPEKFATLLTFAIAIFAGLAVDRFRNGLRRPRWTMAVAAGLTALAAASALAPGAAGRLAVWIAGAHSRHAGTAGRLLPEAFAEAGLLWIFTVVAIELLSRSSRPALAAALAILAVVPVLANRKIARTLTEVELFSPTTFARYQARADPKGEYRTLGESMYRERRIAVGYHGFDDEYLDAGRRLWIHPAPVLWNRGTVLNIDFDVGDFSRVESLRRFSVLAAGYSDSTPLFGSLSLKWGIRFRDQAPLPGYRPFAGDYLQLWDVLPGALPHVRLVERWREETGSVESVAALPRVGAGEVVVETGMRRSGLARAGTVEVIENVPERLRARVEAPDATWLFALRGFWDYRTVLVDGKPVETFPAQLAFSAVPIPAGRHTVVWTERVPGLEVSRFGPVVAVLLLGLLLVRDRRSRRAVPA